MATQIYNPNDPNSQQIGGDTGFTESPAQVAERLRLSGQSTGSIAPKPIEAPPMQSLTTTGQNYLNARTQAGQAVDELSIKKLYRDRGFTDSYGDWRGTDAQYKAMWMQDIQEGINKTKTAIDTETARIAAEKQQQSQAGDTGTGGTTPGITNQPTEEFKNMTGQDYQNMTQNILDKIGTTDLTKLIQDFSTGDLATPETVLNEADKQAQIDKLKADTAAGLSTLQQSLAKRGMTFSGIRTDAEEAFAADALAKESGINRDFAGKIISAARQEQTRRESALTAAEDNYNKALEAQGYVYNPITNTIEKTLQRQNSEFNAAKDLYDINNPKPETAPTSYKEWQLAGGKDGTGLDYNGWLNKQNAKAPLYTEKDLYSAIDKGKTDLQQGEDWGNVWNRIKQQFPDVSNDIIDNALGVSWKEPNAYQNFVAKKKAGNQKIEFKAADGSIITIQ